MKISPLTTSFINPNRKKDHTFTSISFGASEKALEEAKKVFNEYDSGYIIGFHHDVDDEELKAISDFAKENPQCVHYYWTNQLRTYFKNPKEKENFMTLTYTLLNDKEKLDIYSKMSATLNRFLLTPASILAILEQDPKVTSTFFNELLYRQNEKERKFQFLQSSDLINTLESLEEDSVVPYFNMIDYAWKNGQKLTWSPIENYINPKTKKFDPKIVKLAIDLSKKQKTSEGCYYAKNCIDETSGKISKPVVSLLEDIFEFAKKSNYYYVFSYATNSSALATFVDSIKDKNGSFDKDNVKYARELLKPILVDKKEFYPTHFLNISSLIDLSKNDDGIIQKDRFDLIYQAVLDAGSYDTLANALKPLNKCNKSNQDILLKTLYKYLPKNKFNNEYFSAMAKFCIDKDNELIDSHLEFVKKLATIDRELYSSAFFDLAKTYPSQQDYLFELAKNPNFSTLANFQVDFVDLMMDENGEISDENKNRLNAFLIKYNNVDEFSSLYKQCRILEDNVVIGFDDELFSCVLEIVSALKDEEYKFINTKIITLISKDKLDYTSLTFKEKSALCDDIIKIQTKLNNPTIFSGVVEKINKSFTSQVQPLEASDEAKFDFIKEILSSKKDDFTPFESKLVSMIPEFEKMSHGLKLKYSRYEFMSDLKNICKEEFLPICKKLNITAVGNNSYNGIVSLANLDKNNPLEIQVYDLAYKFMYQNSFKTGDYELDLCLNKIISAMPEFINVVDKKQHSTQKHTLDVHILLALAYALNNPNYFSKLSQNDRAVLKFSILFHDIAKPDSVNDQNHPQIGANWMKNISSKIFKTQEMQNRVYEFILNHHWSKDFNVDDKTQVIKQLAFKFRRPNDFEMAKIMAQADMKAVSGHIFEIYGECLKDEGISQIEKTIDFYNSNGNVLLANKIVNPSKLKNYFVEYKNRTFPLINLHLLENDELVDIFGFSYGTKKNDLKFLVHMVDEDNFAQNLQNVSLLTNSLNGGVLSSSLISPEHTSTYGDRKFGVVLSNENTNVLLTTDSNGMTGEKKDFSDVIKLVFDGGAYYQRRNFKENLLFYLPIDKTDVDDVEFSKFYKNYLSKINTLSQINPNQEFKLANAKFSGEELARALDLAMQDLFNKKDYLHNEVVSYNPTLEAVIAKAKTLDEVPFELLDFAVENNLPLILI